MEYPMHIMHIFVAILGILLIYIPLQDGFETIILPRRVARRFRLARLFYILTWALWSLPARKMRAGNRREYYLALFGPLSLVLLLILWAALLILGYACLQWGLYSQLNTTGSASDFGTYLYLSGTTFITLGLGDILPISGLARALVVIEAGTGFAFLALVIGYLPVIYQAFSRREASITLLDARAGSPPSAGELLRRHTHAGNTSKIIEYMHEWEHWCSEILESHISYNVLIFYRSQHPDQSWLGAITTVLDTCALILAGIEGVPIKPIKFTFAIARHAAVDLALILDTPPVKDGNRLPHEDFVRLRAQLAEVGLMLKDGEATEKRLAQLRGMYEPFVEGLARRLLLNLPRWMKQPDQVDDWQTSAWDHFLESSPRTLDRAIVGD
jgi:hypothetical protein